MCKTTISTDFFKAFISRYSLTTLMMLKSTCTICRLHVKSNLTIWVNIVLIAIVNTNIYLEIYTLIFIVIPHIYMKEKAVLNTNKMKIYKVIQV